MWDVNFNKCQNGCYWARKKNARCAKWRKWHWVKAGWLTAAQSMNKS